MKRGLSVAIMLAIMGVSLLTAEAAGPLKLEGSLSLGTRDAHDVVLDASGNFAYVATNLGLTVVDVTDRSAPEERGSVALGGISLGVDRKDNLVFVANMKTGLRVVDVSDPNIPVVVGTKTIPGSGGARAVALKDNIAYVASWPGEMFVIRHSRPAPTSSVPKPPVTLTTVQIIGILAWGSPGGDTQSLKKMNALQASGNAKNTSVSLNGDILITNDFAYGRSFVYDVSVADSPKFGGTHDAPFIFQTGSRGTWIFGFSAFGGTSGIYSVPIGLFDSDTATRHKNCLQGLYPAFPPCDYFQSPTSDYGGMAVSGNYVIYLAGKQGEIRVIDVSDPSNMVDPCAVGRAVAPCALSIVGHRSGLGETMMARTHGDLIFAAVGRLGFRVYSFDDLSN